MEFFEDFKACEAEIMSVKVADIKPIIVPVDVECAEADLTAFEAGKDKELIIKAGLNWDKVEILPKLSNATRYMQAKWMSEYKAKQDVQLLWQERSPLAYSLKGEIDLCL